MLLAAIRVSLVGRERVLGSATVALTPTLLADLGVGKPHFLIKTSGL